MSKPFVFHTSCTKANGDDINAMTGRGCMITYPTMLRYCDLLSWARENGYGDRAPAITLRGDPFVSFHASAYRGTCCYYLVHSAIEHIWIRRGVKLPPPKPNPGEHPVWEQVQRGMRQ